MQVEGMFSGWKEGTRYGFIVPDGGPPNIFLHMDDVPSQARIEAGTRLAVRSRNPAIGGRLGNLG